jgi:hypothetical protein
MRFQRTIPVVTAALLIGCAGKQLASVENALTASLDVIGASVDSASKFAHNTCVSRQQDENTKVSEGVSNTEIASANIQKIRARCQTFRERFDQLRMLHDNAVEFVQVNQLEQAKQELASLKDLWGKFSTEGVTP